MKMSIIRKGVILAACLTAVAAWTVTAKAASQSFKVTLTGIVEPDEMSRRKMSAALFVSLGTRFVAVLSNNAYRPSSEMAAGHESPLPPPAAESEALTSTVA